MQSTLTTQLFKYQLIDGQSFEVRIAGTIDEPLFNAKDVCLILGIANNRDAVARLEPDERASVSVDTAGGKQKMTFINESGLYRLIFSSNKQEAKYFKNWVFREVLPSIRKTGMYQLEKTVKTLEGKVNELEKRRFLKPKENSIPLIERLIQLGFLTEIERRRIYSENNLVLGGIRTGLHHPDRKLFQNHIFRLSKRLSKCRREKTSKNPDVGFGKRNNLYFKKDYDDYGDAIIKAYMLEFRMPQEWGVDFTWGWNCPPDKVIQEQSRR